jgi:hypothetical protein
MISCMESCMEIKEKPEGFLFPVFWRGYMYELIRRRCNIRRPRGLGT